MAGAAGVDYPEERSVVDLLASSRDDVLISWVEAVDDDGWTVTVGEDRTKRRVRLEDGEHVEVVWRGPEELRSRPTELVAVRMAPEPVWHLRPVGPAIRGQRRSAVRAPLTVPVQVTLGTEVVHGSTIDLSESGARVLLGPTALTRRGVVGSGPLTAPVDADDGPDGAEADRPEDPLQLGAVVPVLLCLDDREIPCRGEVVRRVPRGDRRPELSLRFVGLPEKAQDDVRRYVFQELRTLRARGLL